VTDLSQSYRENFRENLKSFRLNKGLTQSELAIEANYDATYVGKLERGASEPSFETIVRLGEALEIYPLKLLRPSRAHLDIRDDIPVEELKQLPYNPLDIQIFDSLPSAMGIITDQGTPVYVNESFTQHTGIDRDDIEEQVFWDLSCWNFGDVDPEALIDAIERVHFEQTFVQFEIERGTNEGPTIDLFLYPTPINHEPEDRMMWIFEYRHPNHDEIDFPLSVSSITRVET
jgi:PAS domain S-box-containing protein